MFSANYKGLLFYWSLCHNKKWKVRQPVDLPAFTAGKNWTYGQLFIERISGRHCTGLPAYTDSAGTPPKKVSLYCKQVSLYPMIFSTWRFFFGPKNCHCNRSVTLTGVTVSGQACSSRPSWTSTWVGSEARAASLYWRQTWDQRTLCIPK